MTRDRPASGAQDNTQDGQFPSDLGGGGGGGDKTQPAAITRPDGGTIGKDWGYNNTALNNVNYWSGGGASPVIRVSDNIISSSLYGVYQFTSQYIFNYYSHSTSITATIGSSASSAVSAVFSPTNTHIGAVSLDINIGATNGTLSAQSAFVMGSVNGLSATYFAAYDSPSINVSNATTLTSNESLDLTLTQRIGPAYEANWFKGDRKLQKWAVIPNSSPTFTLSFTVDNNDSTGSISPFCYMNMVGINGIYDNKIATTIESFS